MPKDSRTLAAHAASGDQAAANELVARFTPELRAVVKKVLFKNVQPRVGVTDVTQVALTAFFHRLATKGPGAERIKSPREYARMVALNQARKANRSNTRGPLAVDRKVELDSGLANRTPDGDGDSRVSDLSADELTVWLEDALASLDDRERAVLRAVFFENQEQNKIAAQLGVTPPRVAQIKAAAIKALQSKLATHFRT